MAHTTVAPAGQQWDAIKVPRHIGLAALETLQGTAGPVIVDPADRALYFFVAPGTSLAWDVPDTRALGDATYVVVPPLGRRMPPGPYWLNPSGGPREHTPAAALRLALLAAIAEADAAKTRDGSS
ncbi:hypothetical protein ACWGCW_01170 [Streptomyces sp. NPDC054933]